MVDTPGDIIRALRAAGVAVWADGGNLRTKGPKAAITPDLATAIKEHRDEIIAVLQREASPVQVSRFLHSALPDGYRGPAIWHRGDVPGGVWQDLVEVTGNAGPGLFEVFNRWDNRRYTVGVAALIPTV